jgi:hypothetical protein
MIWSIEIGFGREPTGSLPNGPSSRWLQVKRQVEQWARASVLKESRDKGVISMGQFEGYPFRTRSSTQPVTAFLITTYDDSRHLGLILSML